MRRSLRWLFLLLTAVTACQSPATPTPPSTTTGNSETGLAPTNTTVTLPTATPTLLSSPEFPPVPLSSPSASPFGSLAYPHLLALSQDIGPRIAGRPAEKQAATYIANAFATIGYTPTTQSFTFTADNGDTHPSANVIAVKQGQSPRELIVGAHYDSVATGRGADDNASGVAVMLEAAERVYALETPYTIRFIAFGAEEDGLQGSTFYANQMTPAAIANTIAMINLDALAAGDITYIYGSPGAAGAIRDWTLQWAEAEGLDLQTQQGLNPEYPIGTTCDCSDHAPFEELGIQYAYFEATNWTLGRRDGYTQVDLSLGDQGQIWHTEHDTITYLEETFPGRLQSHLTLFTTALHHILTKFTL